jgi:hypothetical protein
VYSRFSSDRQSPTSITDQVRKCREHAERHGWAILPEHIYSDEAISGASTEREGLQRLIAAATDPARPFDCILIDDSSRLTRKLADALNLYERLTFAGILTLVGVSSVRHILLNRKYSGTTVWNTRRKVRVPGTGKRVFRPRPESEWVTMDAPHFRIVSDELFTSVQRRFRTVKQMFGREGSGGLAVGPKRYLFSGLLKCDQCGGSIALVSGRGRHGADRYGCALNYQRGNSICTNTLLVRRDELEESLLRGLAESVLRTEAIDYVMAKLEGALKEQFQNLDAELRGLRQRKQQVEAEIGRLVQAIADGQSSKSLVAAIAEREGELKGILDRLLEPGPGSLTETLGNLRAIAMDRLGNLRKLVSNPENVEQTRAVLAEHFGTFKMEPVNENGKLSYRYHGKIDFFGDRAMARTGGAGGSVCTTRRIEFHVSLAA